MFSSTGGSVHTEQTEVMEEYRGIFIYGVQEGLLFLWWKWTCREFSAVADERVVVSNTMCLCSSTGTGRSERTGIRKQWVMGNVTVIKTDLPWRWNPDFSSLSM